MTMKKILENEEQVISLSTYQPIPFFLPVRYKGTEVFLEFQFKKIELYDNVKDLLTDKSKQFIELLDQMTFMNREIVSKKLDELAKELWKK